jgi:hypothetical protein
MTTAIATVEIKAASLVPMEAEGVGPLTVEVEVAEAMGAVVAEEVFEVVVVKGLRQQEDGERTDSRMHSLLSTMTTKKEPRRR